MNVRWTSPDEALRHHPHHSYRVKVPDWSTSHAGVRILSPMPNTWNQRVCGGITTQSKESTLSSGLRSLAWEGTDAVDGLFEGAEMGDRTTSDFANKLAYCRLHCRTCNRLPLKFLAFLNVSSFCSVSLYGLRTKYRRCRFVIS
ncbi:hypothetical protein CDAR_26031 [Caerostris darwini]|uniref:Uncharacterized protein n=1 Tax=Caerostris darwini TaxID=1538125 RepID=A0AAV4MUB7_9ARAC|nr:hypothetical protein CDAR_26031 [Caerostris darwini]